MNFLAHIYLSGNAPDIQLGGFIADAVKGKAYEQYNKNISNGILMHRRIDAFTDNHPVFKQSVERLKPHFGRYSGIVTDMFYDHFLAAQWHLFSSDTLSDFVHRFYVHLAANYLILPKRTRTIVPFCIFDNWLVSYATPEGIKKRFVSMDRRTEWRTGMSGAVEHLLNDYDDYENDFGVFFVDVQQFATSIKSEYQ